MKKDIVNKNENKQLHGIQIGYYTNDQIEYKLNYINGDQHGIQIGYYDNGKIMYKKNYNNGNRHGEQIGYHYTGKIWYKHNYINGNQHGEQIGYNQGHINYKDYYINDELVSKEEYLAYERRSKLTIIKDL
jgi:antitoxin component YwqK of YwqJK toxin-antitoxin module